MYMSSIDSQAPALTLNAPREAHDGTWHMLKAVPSSGLDGQIIQETSHTLRAMGLGYSKCVALGRPNLGPNIVLMFPKLL